MDTNSVTLDEKPKKQIKIRYFIIFFLLFAIVYLIVMQIPSRLVISPETTGLTDPQVDEHGNVDYFHELEKTYIDRLQPPEDNGYRDLLIACGPRILEQNALVDSVPWNNMQTDTNGRNYFDNYWIPLCKQLEIDPYPRPIYLDSRCLYSVAEELELKSRTLPDGTVDENAIDYTERLLNAPWSEEEFPEAAKWLEERNPVLDLFGKSVRKPNFVCPRIRPNDGGTGQILLYDIQGLRELSRDLQARIAFRIHTGDIEGAVHDVESLLILSRRHLMREPFFVTVLVGFSINSTTMNSVRLILESNALTAEQLERFATMLDSMPPALVPELCFITEKSMQYDILHRLPQLSSNERDIYFQSDYDIVKTCVNLPFDMNIASKKLTEIFKDAGYPDDAGESLFEEDTRDVRMEFAAKFETVRNKNNDILDNLSYRNLFSLHCRSEIVASALFAEGHFGPIFMNKASDRTGIKIQFARTGIAIERFRLRNEGELPEKLEELVPEFLDEVPCDLFSPNGESIIYQPAPDEQTLYRLYSRGENGIDNNGEDDDETWDRVK